MDFAESLFGKVSNWKRAKEQEKQEVYAIRLEDQILSIYAFFSMLNLGKKIVIQPGSDLGGVDLTTLYLPSKVVLFNNLELNRKVLLHKALVASVMYKFGIYYYKPNLTVAEKGLQVWCFKNWIQAQLEKFVPNYHSYFDDIFKSSEVVLANLSPPDREFLKWVSPIAPFSTQINVGEMFSQLRALNETLEKLPARRLRQVPWMVLYPWCEFMQPTQSLPFLTSPFGQKRDSIEEPKTELEGKDSSSVEYVDLNSKKDQENPVSHSFEKMETADEYQGGYRVQDGQDELQSHNAALSELNMQSVTRDGESAQSVYRSTINAAFESDEAYDQGARERNFLMYPEWDYKKKALKRNHCRLYINSGQQVCRSDDDLKWRRDLLERHRRQLSYWGQKLQKLLNTEKWVNRQWDGQEIDLDSYNLFFSDLAHGVVHEAPLYCKQKKREQDSSCILLLDQSYSTDSWVCNQRVLDVELESIGLSALMTPFAEKRFEVAGTWSETRNHCYYTVYKSFDQPWTEFFRHAQSIEPSGYTRLGPAIRHSTYRLSQLNSKNKLLILLTDGKPTDYDRYEGRYGIEDIHNAIVVAKNLGVKVKALAIEKKAIYHFPVLFGQGGYQVLNDPAMLPQAIWKIFLQSLFNL